MSDNMVRVLHVPLAKGEKVTPSSRTTKRLSRAIGRNRPPIALACTEFPAYNTSKEELSNEL